jgi:DNA polymerase-3 subunit alpha
MPDFPLPKDSGTNNLNEYLKKLTYEGLKKRFNNNITFEIKERADFELDVIEKMNFPGYFLIVHDLIKSARELGVRVGPGRGSAVGSLIAYALEITNINPLDYDLLFERFLNPERISMPDIDIDFCDIGREKVIEYVKQKYGENSVAQIISFGKLTSKAVLKAVGRVMNIHHTEINKITAKIPQILGKVLPLKDALDIPDLKEFRDSNDEKTKNLIQYSLLLENLNVNTSTHAAGIVIAPGEITEFVPLYQSNKEDKTEILTQYSKYDLEYVGLLKMDLLGIQTLSIIDNIIDMIKENYGIEIDIDNIDFQDKATYELLSSGNTLSIFQFESSGMQEYLYQLKPHNIEELTAMNALYRPGPMSNIPEFIDRKHGKKNIEYLHPLMEKSLNKTYGIIVYQEQVMQLARDIAGFTLGQADILRRAMGAKKKESMLKMKPQFIEGAKKNGLNEALADEIFHLIEKFAGYGFNKSHALAYSYLAFQTAWLKAHYPTEFYAANMTAEINKPQNKSKNIVALIEEAKKFGIIVLPPDVNQSMDTFTAKANTIFFGLSAIMNVGSIAAKAIIKARNQKPFTSIFDFCSRCDIRQINKKTLEALICSGAFDSLKTANRATLLASIEIALDYGKAYQERSTSNDTDLFGDTPIASIKEPILSPVEDWSEKKRLQLEKQFLKFYISGHPMMEYKAYIDALSIVKLGETDNDLVGKTVRVCALITDITTRFDKNNNTFANITIEDYTGSAECIIWHRIYTQFKSLIEIDKIVLIIGKLELDNNDNLKIIVDQILTIDDALNLFAKGISIIINNENNNIKKIEELAKICNQPNAKTNIFFHLYNQKQNNTYEKYMAKNINLSLNFENLEKIFSIFGKNNVKILTSL